MTRATLAFVATLFVACAPRVPGIADPTRVDAHCNPREARITSLRSVLTSTNDELLAGEHPTFAAVRAETRAGDGAIAYWNDQPLALPKTSVALGETDGFVRVRALAVAPTPSDVPSRTIYLEVRDRGAYRWIAMRAFDVQDVCVEGHKQQ